MDDLEEVWGPRGRATLDPGSIRPVVPSPLVARPAAMPPPALAATDPASIGEITATSSTPAEPRPQPILWVGAGVFALIAAVVVVALVARSGSEPPAPVVATGSTATTIVSAAADLLGRSTTRPPAEATAPAGDAASTPAAPASTTPVSTAPPTPAGAGPASVTGVPPLVEAENAARHFIEVLVRRDCDGLWALLSRGTQAFLVGSAEPGEPSGRDARCEGLRSEEIPAMRVHGPAVAEGNRAAVPLESEGAVEDLHFVAEDGRWAIDLFGDFGDES